MGGVSVFEEICEVGRKHVHVTTNTAIQIIMYINVYITLPSNSVHISPYPLIVYTYPPTL